MDPIIIWALAILGYTIGAYFTAFIIAFMPSNMWDHGHLSRDLDNEPIFLFIWPITLVIMILVSVYDLLCWLTKIVKRSARRLRPRVYRSIRK